MSEVKTYVAGHKSPDTDSICSAISFANLLIKWVHQQLQYVQVKRTKKQHTF